MTYENIFAISLYRVIGRIKMMTLHLEMTNKGSDMSGRTWDHVCDVSAKIRCPRDPGVGICAWLCVYVFGIVRIVVYDVRGCHMSVIIDPGYVDCFCSCVMNFMMFLAYFRDNNEDIITDNTMRERRKPSCRVYCTGDIRHLALKPYCTTVTTQKVQKQGQDF